MGPFYLNERTVFTDSTTNPIIPGPFFSGPFLPGPFLPGPFLPRPTGRRQEPFAYELKNFAKSLKIIGNGTIL